MDSKMDAQKKAPAEVGASRSPRASVNAAFDRVRPCSMWPCKAKVTAKCPSVWTYGSSVAHAANTARCAGSSKASHCSKSARAIVSSPSWKQVIPRDFCPKVMRINCRAHFRSSPTPRQAPAPPSTRPAYCVKYISRGAAARDSRVHQAARPALGLAHRPLTVGAEYPLLACNACPMPICRSISCCWRPRLPGRLGSSSNPFWNCATASVMAERTYACCPALSK